MDFTIDMLNSNKQNLYFARRKFDRVPNEVEKYVNDKGENIADWLFSGRILVGIDMEDKDYVREIKKKHLITSFLSYDVTELIIVYKHKSRFYNCQDHGIKLKNCLPLDTCTLFHLVSFVELCIDLTKVVFEQSENDVDSGSVSILPDYAEVFSNIKQKYAKSGSIFDGVEIFELA